MFPEMWPHFKLMDDALEGRLAGSAPILTVLHPDKDDTDYLPTFKPKRRKIPVLKSTPAVSNPVRSEVEISLKSDEETTDEGDVAQGESAEIERVMQEVENERALLESERTMMQSEREVLEREKQVLERERATLEREIATLDRDRASLERERAAIERERVVMEREKALLERDRDAVSRDRLALDRDRARLDRVTADKERTESTAEGEEDREMKDSVTVDRKERFLDLFEKLIDKF